MTNAAIYCLLLPLFFVLFCFVVSLFCVCVFDRVSTLSRQGTINDLSKKHVPLCILVSNTIASLPHREIDSIVSLVLF